MEKKKRNKNVGEKIAELVLVEDRLTKCHQWRLCVSLQYKPITEYDYYNAPKIRPDIRTTSGIYYIKYVPRCDRWRVLAFPYVFVNDITNKRIVVSGPEHLKALANEIPEIRFILDNSSYDDELFNIAAMHPGIKIPFCLDSINYCKKIIANACNDNIDINDRPLVSCIRNNDNEKLEYHELFKVGESMLPSRHTYDTIVENMKAKFDKGEL